MAYGGFLAMNGFSNSAIDDLLNGLSQTRERELLEELYSAYSSSSVRRPIFIDIENRYSQILKDLDYKDRLQKVKSTEGSNSRLKNGIGPWPGVKFFPERNTTRLFILRLKRQTDAIAAALHSNVLKNTVDKTNLGFSMLGIIWYLPRFLRHTALILKHMATNKKNRSDYFRKFWFEWFNDMAWIATGIITLGISTGWYLAPWSAALGPGGLALTVALYAFDVLNAAAKAYTKIRKLNRIIANVNQKIEIACWELELNCNQNIEDLHNAIENKRQRIAAEINRTLAKLKGSPDEDTKNHLHRLLHQQDTVGKLKDLVEIKQRMELKKTYLKYDQWSKVAVATGLLAGMALMLSGPIGVAIGAGIVLATCAIQYWVNHYYLPKKEVQLAYNPLELLHSRVSKHIESQIAKLTKLLENSNESHGKTQVQTKTRQKLERYLQAQEVLVQWEKNPRQDNATELLYQGIDLAMEASKIRRKRNITPASYKSLRSIVKTFSTPWREEYKQSETTLRPLIDNFTQSSKIDSGIDQHSNHKHGKAQTVFFRKYLKARTGSYHINPTRHLIPA